MPTDPASNIEPPDLFVIQRNWMTRALIFFAVGLVGLAVFGLYLRYRPIEFDPVRWKEANGTGRGRMLKSLLAQTDFAGYTRSEVVFYLGPANYDERLFWYDLGPDAGTAPADPRGNVGKPNHLYGIFQHDRGGVILEVLYSHRRPTLGSAQFDSTVWFSGDPSVRRTMFTNVLGRLRNQGLTSTAIQTYLGPPDGWRVLGQYDVGFGGAIYGGKKALIFEFDSNDVVISSEVPE
jgi:hypothetical protein